MFLQQLDQLLNANTLFTGHNWAYYCWIIIVVVIIVVVIVIVVIIIIIPFCL